MFHCFFSDLYSWSWTPLKGDGEPFIIRIPGRRLVLDLNVKDLSVDRECTQIRQRKSGEKELSPWIRDNGGDGKRKESIYRQN